MQNISKLESLDTQTLKYILKNAILDKQEAAQKDFLTFVKAVWPDFVEGNPYLPDFRLKNPALRAGIYGLGT